MISRVSWVCLIKVNIRIENGIPDCHEAGVVSNVLGVVEDVVGSVSTERDQSEDAPWEFIAAMSVVGFENSNKTPLNDGEEMELRTEDEHAEHGGVMVSKGKLEWMSVLACNTDWVHELVMLFVDHLVKREVLMFAV